MITIKQLKKIFFFQGLSDKILIKIAEIAEIETHKEKTELFSQNQKLSYFYMVLSGKIFLNSRSSKGISLTLNEVTPGTSFGLSAIIGDVETSFSAICAEKTELIKISNGKMLKLFEEDKKLGYFIMLKVVQLFNSIMKKHTQKLLKSIGNHPEIKKNL